ncbi:hypothetical protein V1277_006609 [Bradyrhizobium sp. AZCC 1588]
MQTIREGGSPVISLRASGTEAGIRRGAPLLVPSSKAVLPAAVLRYGGLAADRSVLKRNTDEIALPPDHAAFANVVKIIEGQFEIQGQQVEVVEFNSSPGIRDILNAAGEYTALSVKEQQRAF